MSVLIKGREMPKSCDMCWALDDYGDYPRCRITEEQRGYNFPVREQRMSKCPLVPVPPHGRLIDADALVLPTNLNDWNSVVEYVHNITDCWKAIDNASTIIPADKEDGE